MVHRSRFLGVWIVVAVAVVGGALAVAQVAAPPVRPAQTVPKKPEQPRAEPGAPDVERPPGAKVRTPDALPRQPERGATENRADRRAAPRQGLGIAFDTAVEGGLGITTIEEGSIAAEAGLRAKDKIISVDGRTFANQRQLQAYLGGQMGRRVPFIIERGGQRYSVQFPMNGNGDGAWLGVYLQENDEGGKGAAITHVYPAGPASRAGLRSGDVVVKVNGKEVEASADLIAHMEELDARSKAELVVLRGKQEIPVNVVLGSRSHFVHSGGNDSFRRNHDFGQHEEMDDDNDDDDYFSRVPPYAMQMEHDRRMAEQHERMETAITKLQEEVRKLREAVERKN